jgi:hypothetical protein
MSSRAAAMASSREGSSMTVSGGRVSCPARVGPMMPSTDTSSGIRRSAERGGSGGPARPARLRGYYAANWWSAAAGRYIRGFNAGGPLTDFGKENSRFMRFPGRYREARVDGRRHPATVTVDEGRVLTEVRVEVPARRRVSVTVR